MTSSKSDLAGKQGGCLCGAIRYRLELPPMYIQACHCNDCQTVSGSAFVINMWCAESEVIVSGEAPVSWKNVAGSGKTHEIFACPACGTDIWSKYHASIGNDIMVRAGTLDDARDVEPQAHIFTRSKHEWVQLSDDRPVFEKFYNLYELWPEASIERFNRLREKAG